MKKTAFVTGGNRGIGLEIVRGLVEQGLDVVIGSRNLEEGQQAATDTGASKALTIDLSSRESIKQAANALGRVDVLINNAGVLFRRSMIDHPQDFEDCIRVMVQAPYQLIHTFVPGMRQNHYGRIVNVSSGWGAFSSQLEGPGAYGMAKAALNAMTLALSRELPNDIKINAMCPGWVQTRMGGEEASSSPQQGADTAIWLATLEAVGPTGGFFRDRQRIDW